MPEGARGLLGPARLVAVHVRGDDGHLPAPRVMELGEDVGHERTEAAAEIQEPVEVLLQVRDDDGQVIQESLLEHPELSDRRRSTRIDAANARAEWRVERFHVEPTAVHFRTLSDSQINAYLNAEEPFDCAGSFKAEALGIALFERIETQDPTALQGLPMIWLSTCLRNRGVALF